MTAKFSCVVLWYGKNKIETKSIMYSSRVSRNLDHKERARESISITIKSPINKDPVFHITIITPLLVQPFNCHARNMILIFSFSIYTYTPRILLCSLGKSVGSLVNLQRKICGRQSGFSWVLYFMETRVLCCEIYWQVNKFSLLRSC